MMISTDVRDRSRETVDRSTPDRKGVRAAVANPRGDRVVRCARPRHARARPRPLPAAAAARQRLLGLCLARAGRVERPRRRAQDRPARGQGGLPRRARGGGGRAAAPRALPARLRLRLGRRPCLHRVRVRRRPHAARCHACRRAARRRRRSRRRARSSTGSRTPTGAASCIATSSRRTCCSPTATAVSVRLLDFGLAQFDEADTLTAVGDVPGHAGVHLARAAPRRGGRARERRVGGRDPALGGAGRPPSVLGRPAPADGGRDRGRRAGAPARAARPAEAAASGRRPRARCRPGPAAVRRRSRRGAPPRLGRAAAAAEKRARRRLRMPSLRVPRPYQPRADVHPARARGARGARRRADAALLSVGLAVRAGRARRAASRSRARGSRSRSRSRCPCCRSGTSRSGWPCSTRVVAAGWLALMWRDARNGLLCIAGPLLLPLGLLALLPLVAQLARGPVRRAAHVLAGVGLAALSAGLAGHGRSRSAAASPGRSASPRARACDRSPLASSTPCPPWSRSRHSPSPRSPSRSRTCAASGLPRGSARACSRRCSCSLPEASALPLVVAAWITCGWLVLARFAPARAQ